MWNSFGSIRDRVRENANRVRENAKAAAQVAHGMLQVAAAEEEDLDPSATPPNPKPDQTDRWDDWGASAEQPTEPSGQQHVGSPPPPPAPADGRMDAGSMPPPLAPPSLSSSAEGGRRKSRYVVTGLEEKGGGGLVPLRPGGVGLVTPATAGVTPAAVGGGFAVKEDFDLKENGDGDGSNGWDEDGTWDVAEVNLEGKTAGEASQEPAETFGGKEAPEDLWEAVDEWNVASVAQDKKAGSELDGRVDDWEEGREWNVVDGAGGNDKPVLNALGEMGKVDVNIEAGTDGTSGKLSGQVSSSLDTEWKANQQSGGGGTAVKANKTCESQTERNESDYFNREWSVPVDEKSVAEPDSFWGGDDSGNGSTTGWDGDWNMTAEDGSRHDAGKDWGTVATRADESAEATFVDEGQKISAVEPHSTTADVGDSTAPDTSALHVAQDEGSSFQQAPQVTSLPTDDWQMSTEDQAEHSQTKDNGFGWETMQPTGHMSNNDAAVDWFSAGGAGVAETENGNESEAFFDDVSRGNSEEQIAVRSQEPVSRIGGEALHMNERTNSRAEPLQVGNIVETPAEQEPALIQGSYPLDSDANSGTKYLEQATMEVAKKGFPLPQADVFRSNTPEATSSKYGPDQQDNESSFVREPSFTSPSTNANSAIQSSPRQQEQGNAINATLLEEIRQLKVEKDSFIVTREANEREISDLKQLIANLREDVSSRDMRVNLLAEEKGHLLSQRDELARQKSLVERERDAAIEKGGDDVRKATGAIDVMRDMRDAVERREAAIAEQIECLRVDLDLISGQRNSLVAESDELKVRLSEVEAQSKSREDGLREQIQLMKNETEIVQLERDKALIAAQLHVREHEELLETEKATSASLMAAEIRVRELQTTIDSIRGDRDEETTRIEALSTQVAEMKRQIENVIEERNALRNEKSSMERDIEALNKQGEETQRALQDAQRVQQSLLSERDEARTRYGGLRDQLKDLSSQLEATNSERDRLVQERASFATSSSSVTNREKALTTECQQKTAMITGFQRKLKVALTKIEKLSTQKATCQRQRDEAGARLRAAGAEFAQLTSKLEIATTAKDKLQEDLNMLRDEKDKDLAHIQDLSEKVLEMKILEENLERSANQVKELEESLRQSFDEMSKLNNEKSALQQKCNNLATDASSNQGKCEVLMRERDMLQSKLNAIDEDKKNMQVAIDSLQSSLAEFSKGQKAAEAELATAKEKAAFDIGVVRAELAAEKNIRAAHAEKLANLQSRIVEHEGTSAKMADSIKSSFRAIKEELQARHGASSKVLESISRVDFSDSDDYSQAASEVVTNVCGVLGSLANEHACALDNLSELQEEMSEMTMKLESAKQENTEATANDEKLAELRAGYDAARQQLEGLLLEKRSLETHCRTLEATLQDAEVRAAELDDKLRVTSSKMQEIEEKAKVTAEEKSRLSVEVEESRSKLESIWRMLQKSMASQQIELYSESIDDYESSRGENIAVLALRTAASIVAELERNRLSSQDVSHRLAHAEAEVTRLTDRAEIAEKERDALRGSNERLEKKIKVAKGEGEADAKKKFEVVRAQYEDELDDTKHELENYTDRAKRAEKEAGELRALCSKLTSQFNGRTNELDEAEEKVVYLQDQVTNLEEDLEEAHRRLREHEEVTAEARRSDVDRLRGKLDEAMGQVERLETECARLQESCDKAEIAARESELAAETHRRAEGNLQIAIEQLEAGLESRVEEKTIEIQKKMQKAEERYRDVMKREEEMAMTENKLGIRDDEIKELRSAIGRLADERVELKLELEKSLSRLNHPDAGGELVDRRVVRQLLVSYFRVGSLRRRDVLELMSRMLAFSEGDKVAVGLKRRALMERIGSLVQAPEMEDAQLAPLGTVSDKWIEFLMKETEEGEEDQEKGW